MSFVSLLCCFVSAITSPIQPDQGAVAGSVVLLWFCGGLGGERGVLSPVLCAHSAVRHRSDGVAGSAGWRPRLAA